MFPDLPNPRSAEIWSQRAAAPQTAALKGTQGTRLHPSAPGCIWSCHPHPNTQPHQTHLQVPSKTKRGSSFLGRAAAWMHSSHSPAAPAALSSLLSSTGSGCRRSAPLWCLQALREAPHSSPELPGSLLTSPSPSLTPRDVLRALQGGRHPVGACRLLGAPGFDFRVILGCEGRSENVCFATKKRQASLKLSAGKERQKPAL